MGSSLSTSNWLLVALGLGIVVALKFRVFHSTSRRPPYPPGPPKNWITGNLSDIMVKDPWFIFTKWANKYGGIVHIRVLHTHTMVVNDLETAIDLFEKRSNVYSSRAPTPMVDMLKDFYITGFLPYNDRWRDHRRMFQKILKSSAVQLFEKRQYQQADDLLCRLRDAPDDFVNHLRLRAQCIMMSAIYDYDAVSADDQYLDLAEKFVDKIGAALLPGAFMVNHLPFLQYVPEWFPGAGFKAYVRETQVLTDQMTNDTLQTVQDRIDAGENPDCFAAKLMEGCQSDLIDIKSICGTAYAGGGETTVSVLHGFFYAIANHPDVLRRAQEEIDEVIGSDRLPAFEDRSSLPYIEAIYRETLRWHPVLPVGIPHYTTEDDVYNGYYIPKGTTVISNLWAMGRDPKKYIDPDAFNPSRFFEKDGSLNDDDVRLVFGFGRRICPGRHLSADTIWLTLATVLATFNVKKKNDASGQEIPVDGGYTCSALTIHPHPFECDISPRSENARRLIPEGITQRHS